MRRSRRSARRRRRRRPRAPRAVAARARRRQERDVVDAQAVELGPQRLAQRSEQRARVAGVERRARRHGPVQHQHAHVRARRPRRQRLPVRPDAQHRVGGARVVLGDDGDAHHSCRQAASVVAGLLAVDVRPAGQEALGLGLGGGARVGRGDGPQVADRRDVDDPERQPGGGGRGGPVRVQPPAHLQRGERQQDAERVGVDRRHRPELDEARAPGEQPRAPARDRPGGVRRERVRGLGEAQAEALGREQERVEEAGGQHDVVVDDQQPVGAVGRVRGEAGAQVGPLAERRARRPRGAARRRGASGAAPPRSRG